MKLTVEQKVELLDGLDMWHTKPLDNMPSIMMTDGPHGLRKQRENKDALGMMGSVPATCFPTASLTACSFDRELLKKMGKAIAKEAKANQVNIVLGPGINMKRSPLCGRNFEYFSEDPLLAGELAAAFVRAVEDEGVGTSVKHFFANNQERYRFHIDSIVDERALYEIYLKAFERVIRENPATVMASYNKINGAYATEHPLIQKVLRKQWGYRGVVISDWGAIHDRIESIKAGTDLEMPTSFGYRTQQVLKNIQKDELLRTSVTKSVERITEMVKKYKINQNDTYDIDDHHRIAKTIASQSMVLLKNQDILPLNKKDKVTIIGGFAESIRYQGGGSSHINPTKLTQIKDIASRYSKHVTMAKGYHLEDTKKDHTLIEEAIQMAKEAEKIVYLIGLTDREETEGFDRNHLNLPENQLALLSEISKVNPNIIAVVVSGSVVNLSFEHDVKGLLMAYLGGQASAEAIMDILYGVTNPSGRLAETFIDDIQSCNVQLTDDNHAVYYDESIFIGYRYYQSFNKKVRYPFGYGLSYTTFDYQTVLVDQDKDIIHIEIEIKNTGNISGKEVIQIYVDNNKSTVYKARRELKAFEKVSLEPGETKKIQIDLDQQAFAFYDIYKKRFVVEKGIYQIVVAKDACHDIESIEIEIDGEDVHHPVLSYQKYIYDTSDFHKIYQQPLPPKHVKKKRPFTLSSTLEDAKGLWIGRMIAKRLIRDGLKSINEASDPWMAEVAKKTLMETPIRMLVLFSSGQFTFTQGEGLVDVLNRHFLKGLKKLRKGS